MSGPYVQSPFKLSFQEWFEAKYPKKGYVKAMPHENFKILMKEAWDDSRANLSWDDI